MFTEWHYVNLLATRENRDVWRVASREQCYSVHRSFSTRTRSRFTCSKTSLITTMASQITSLTVVYSTVSSDAYQRKHQSTAPLAFVWGIHRDRWIPRTKDQLRGKCFHLMKSSCCVYPEARYLVLFFLITPLIKTLLLDIPKCKGRHDRLRCFRWLHQLLLLLRSPLKPLPKIFSHWRIFRFSEIS